MASQKKKYLTPRGTSCGTILTKNTISFLYVPVPASYNIEFGWKFIGKFAERWSNDAVGFYQLLYFEFEVNQGYALQTGCHFCQIKSDANNNNTNYQYVTLILEQLK